MTGLIINHTIRSPTSGCPPHYTDPGTLCCCVAGSPSPPLSTSDILCRSALLTHPASDSTLDGFYLSDSDQGCLVTLALILIPHTMPLFFVKALLSSLGSDESYWKGGFTHHTWVLTYCVGVLEYALTTLGRHPLISSFLPQS